jgi:peptidoglycan/xylan/chitin deacetylase (PgdA/CDA1 family)
MTARALLASLLALLFSLTLTAAPKAASKPASDDAPTAIVLCYHIVEGAGQSRFEITRETFRQHLRYLQMTGYNVIPLRHLYEYVSGKRSSIPKNAIVITIDDGWADTYTEAYPELQKRKFPFTVFIYPNIIGKTANALSWKQIREMSDNGVDIQSHSLTHPFLTRRKHGSLNDGAYAAWLQRELSESKRLLEDKLGRKVNFLAYPYGDYDGRVAATAAKAGYDAAVTCDFGRVKRGSDPLRMKRVVIDRRMDFASFRKYLGAERMMLAELTPNAGEIKDGAVTTISAKIPDPKSLDPKSVGMALISLGSALPYSYDANTGAIKVTLQETLDTLKGKYHRAIVWATDLKTGKRVEASWAFKFPDPPAPPTLTATPAAPVAAAAAAPTLAAVVPLTRGHAVGNGGSSPK